MYGATYISTWLIDPAPSPTAPGSRTRQLANSSPRFSDRHEDYIIISLDKYDVGIESINLCS